MAILVLIAAVSLAALLCEFVVRGSKLQSNLGKVILVYAIVSIPTVAYLAINRQIGFVPSTVFWCGAFLTWFGIRSHIESSILLRMVYILRQQPLASPDLLRAYRRHYDPGERMEELHQAGLLVLGNGDPYITPKGRLIARAVRKLR